MLRRIVWLGAVLLMGGCFQSYGEGDDELSEVPVTNNPHIVPQHGLPFLPLGEG